MTLPEFARRGEYQPGSPDADELLGCWDGPADAHTAIHRVYGSSHFAARVLRVASTRFRVAS